jgi:hypothetical protein
MKKWFSLAELIVVVGIISILMVSFAYHLNDDHKDYLYAETCINKIHWDMNNFLYYAMTSKWLYVKSGTTNTIIYPIKYTIGIDANQNKILLKYTDTNNTTGTFLINDLWWSQLWRSYCSFKDGYITKLSWSSYEINIDKQPINEQAAPSFSINTPWTFSQTTEMYLCYKEDLNMLTWFNICKEIAHFTTDVRTQTIKKKRCISIDKRTIEDGTGNYSRCLQRDQ